MSLMATDVCPREGREEGRERGEDKGTGRGKPKGGGRRMSKGKIVRATARATALKHSGGLNQPHGPIASFFFGDSQRMAVKSAVSWN